MAWRVLNPGEDVFESTLKTRTRWFARRYWGHLGMSDQIVREAPALIPTFSKELKTRRGERRDSSSTRPSRV